MIGERDHVLAALLGDAVDQAGFQGTHVVDGFQDRVGNRGATFHIKNN